MKAVDFLRRNFHRLGAGGTSPVGWAPALVIVAFCVGMLLVPWEDAAKTAFWDRGVYLNTFGVTPSAPRWTLAGGPVAFISNEVLWDWGVRWTSATFGIRVESVFVGITFLSLYAFSKYLVSRHGLLSLAFLINPLIVDFSFSQLRMALAVALLMFAMFRGGGWWACLLLLTAACIHTATFLLLFLYFSAKLITMYLAPRSVSGFYYWAALTLVGLLVVLVIGPFRAALLSMIGDRRADYDAVSQGFKYASFWILLLLMAGTQGKKYAEIGDNAMAVAFVAVFVFASFLNVYNVRFLSAAYPMIVSSMLTLGFQRRVIILPLYALYTGLQWWYWIGRGA